VKLLPKMAAAGAASLVVGCGGSGVAASTTADSRAE
jgi:hypothetical protein